jgi:flagellar motor protein MotB
MLVRFGVDADRLVVDGFGETRPRVDETTVYARVKNRRVEFLILERREVSRDVTPVSELLPKEDQP